MAFVLGDSASASPDALRAAVGQLDVWWFSFRGRIEGLTDDEYWWKPVPDAYSLVERDGQWFCSWPPGSQGEAVPPVTTIAWRMAHVGLGCFVDRWFTYFDEDAGDFTEIPYPGDAAGAIAQLDESFALWQASVRSVGEDGAWRTLGDTQDNIVAMQLGRDDPFLSLILHINREVMHHGAEICLLRDLYRARNLT